MNESEKREVFKDVVDRVNQQLEGHSMFKELKDAINNHHKIKFGRNGKADYQEFMDKYYDEPSKYMRSIFMETGTPFARKIASLHSKISEDLGLSRKVEDAYKTENLDWDSIYLNSQQPSAPVTPEQKRTRLRQRQQVEAMSVTDFLDRETPHVEFYYDGEKRSMEYETTPDSFHRGKLKKQVEQDLFKKAAWAIEGNSSTGLGIIKSNGVIYQISRESRRARPISKEEATKLLSPVSENVNSETIAPKPSVNTELIDEAIATKLGFPPVEVKYWNQLLTGEKQPSNRYEEKDKKLAEGAIKKIIELKKKSKSPFEFISNIQSNPLFQGDGLPVTNAITTVLQSEANSLMDELESTTFTIKGYKVRQQTGLESALSIQPKKEALDIPNQEGFSFGNDVFAGLGANIGSVYIGGFHLGRYDPSIATKIAALIATNKNIGQRVANQFSKNEKISKADRDFIQFILKHLAPSRTLPSNWKSDSYDRGWGEAITLLSISA